MIVHSNSKETIRQMNMMADRMKSAMKMLVEEVGVSFTHTLIDRSIIGQQIYPTKGGEFVNYDVGGYKNNWHLSFDGEPSRKFTGNPSGADAYSSAIGQEFNFGTKMYIHNTSGYADQVEYGWGRTADSVRFRSNLGWESPIEGYDILTNFLGRDAKKIAQESLLNTIRKMKTGRTNYE